MEGLLVEIEASALAARLRQSVWLYPAANVAHVLGIMGLFAAVAAMDLRVLRAGTIAEARLGIARLRPVAALLLLAQVASGILLLLPEATHVTANPVFRLKLMAILLALGNVLGLEAVLGRRERALPLPGGARVAAAVSMTLWLVVAALGRLIAYF